MLHTLSLDDREHLARRLLASLPRSRLAALYRALAPLLQFDILAALPTELALNVLSYLPAPALLTCTLVSKRWQALADDPSLWKALCDARGWRWRPAQRVHDFMAEQEVVFDGDDEGMGDSDADEEQLEFINDSGFVSTTTVDSLPRSRSRARPHSAPSTLAILHPPTTPSYKLLHQTHTRLRARFLASSYRLLPLQTRGGSSGGETGHTSTIYCLHLHTYPSGTQVLFTGSRDKTVREWNLATRTVVRVFGGVHVSSVLSICAVDGWLVSAGSDRRVALWDLESGEVKGVVCDHEDSVLCVRVEGDLLVSCSKDRTVRVYTFPALKPLHTLRDHRAAVNAISISSGLIVSGSGDRSVRLWNAHTGTLLRTFENHHTRGIASIDFSPPYILSGSSDKHLRLFDITTLRGWGTAPPEGTLPYPGSTAVAECAHTDLVRSVALGEEWVVSGSYDLSIKVWSRKTGALIANLTGGHTGRIFCVAFDCAKIVSCGEDQRVCVWDFAHGMDVRSIWL